MTDTQKYRLKQGIERITRAGLHIERGESVELTEEEAARHEELQPVGGTTDDDGGEEAAE